MLITAFIKKKKTKGNNPNIHQLVNGFVLPTQWDSATAWMDFRSIMPREVRMM